MKTLLEEIRKISPEAAKKLKREDYCSDADIRKLTEHDLRELLPGFSNVKTRKKIYDTIHKKRPIHSVLNELKSLVPDEFLKDALSNKGAFHEYLQTLKELKAQMSHVLEFLEAHIDLLEKYGQDTETTKDEPSVPSAGQYQASAASAVKPEHVANSSPMEHQFYPQRSQASHVSSRYEYQNFGHFETQGRSQIPHTPQMPAMMTYKMVVSGNTLNRHVALMEKVKSNLFLNLQETQYDDQSQVIIVVCPVVSRAGTDVMTALQDISETKPVILVMMHHTRQAQTPPNVKPCDHNVVLLVHVFFHETEPGLLRCQQNEDAVASIQNQLQRLCAGPILN